MACAWLRVLSSSGWVYLKQERGGHSILLGPLKEKEVVLMSGVCAVITSATNMPAPTTERTKAKSSNTSMATRWSQKKKKKSRKKPKVNIENKQHRKQHAKRTTHATATRTQRK